MDFNENVNKITAKVVGKSRETTSAQFLKFDTASLGSSEFFEPEKTIEPLPLATPNTVNVTSYNCSCFHSRHVIFLTFGAVYKVVL